MKTPEDVMIECQARCPQILSHIYFDRAWLWYAGPSLQGEQNKETREAMKTIGFRFAPKGRDLGGDLTGTWAHSCVTPIARRRGPKGKTSGNGSPISLPDEEFNAALAAL